MKYNKASKINMFWEAPFFRVRGVLRFSIAIISLFFIISCENSTIEVSDKDQTTEKKELENNTEKEGVLRLNNGKKWEVVPEMMAYLKYMEEDVNKFDGKELSDYQNLATDLSINVDLLTANCTMKGEAHDQLHIWLVPYIGLVNDFATVKNENNAGIKMKELKNRFKEFDEFFR